VRRVGLRGTTVLWGAPATGGAPGAGEAGTAGAAGAAPAGGAGGRVVLRIVDRARQHPSEVLAYTRVSGRETPVDAGRTVTIARRRVVACGQGVTPIPVNGLVLGLPTDPMADELVAALAPGTPLRFTLPVVCGEGRIVAAMAGGPLLLAHGQVKIDLAAEDFGPGLPPVTFGEDATGDQNLLPRLAWGILDDHRLVAVAVDGRNVERSLGETLDGLARLLRELGCHTALNFDGGSSKRMCVEGRVVDLSTTSLVADNEARAAVRSLSSAWIVGPA
jgi:hypothetical protein